MRPGQQNRRMRGRGNRKAPNPLSRNYESNGPDVKIRGNAQHIAEKYTTLARDAQAAGDRVMAENYLQHAEHYNRIIMAAQAQVAPQFQRDESYDDEGDEIDGFEAEPRPRQHNGHAAPVDDGSGPQPEIDGTPAEVVLGEDAGGTPVEASRANGHDARAAAEGDESADGGEPAATERRRPRRAPRRRAPREGDSDAAAAPAQAASGDDTPVAEVSGS